MEDTTETLNTSTEDVNQVESSILNSIKKLLGIAANYTQFDSDIIMHVNSVFMILHQLGVGPDNGFRITGVNERWEDYITDNDNLDAVKTYIHLKVKVVFDPPLNSTVMEAHKQMISELEWRLNVQTEEEA